MYRVYSAACTKRLYEAALLSYEEWALAVSRRPSWVNERSQEHWRRWMRSAPGEPQWLNGKD